MTARTLKIIAIMTMTIDHIGLYLLPDGSIFYDLSRAVGRIAFPLFAFFIAEGFAHTTNLKKYFLRLLIYALVIELGLLVYYLVTKENLLFNANIFWVLVFGLGALWLAHRPRWFYQAFIIVLLFGAEWLQIPYGAYGIFMILMFGFVRKPQWQILGMIMINLLFINYPLFVLFGHSELAKYPWIQWCSLLAMGPLFFYNHLRGRGSKWLFYLYYPLHLAVILGVRYLI